MILILSQCEGEDTTEEVMQWVQYYNGKAMRLNGIDMTESNMAIDLNSNENVLFKPQSVKVVWFRRYMIQKKPILEEFDSQNYMKFELYKAREYRQFYNLILSSFTNCKFISSLSIDNNLNKLLVLRMAKEVGIRVPKSIVTNNKKDAIHFLTFNNESIVKPLSNGSYFRKGNVTFKMLTRKIKNNNFNNIHENFVPSFLQEYITKEYEIRTFFWFGEFYSMAIFSQENEKTQVDFRNYDKLKPNRTVPYKLPIKIENKISALMDKLDLETGSIDLIKSMDGDYVFLEVNPNGQFSMVSHPCNYFLEELVAKKLIKIDRL